MSFETLQDFIAMGGHGPYVWGSYGAGVAVLIINLVHLAFSRRRTLDALKRAVDSLEDV